MSGHQLPPHLSKPPAGPLEILVPEEWSLAEPPRFIGKVISFLVASSIDTNTIEFDVPGRSSRSSDLKLQEYLVGVAKEGELGRLLEHCRAAMHPSDENGALGWFGAVQQEWAYTFVAFERSASPHSVWEVRRTVRRVQAESRESPAVGSGLLARLGRWFTGKS